MVTSKELLLKYWGYESFRAPQQAIVKAVLQKENVFVMLPTGAGKSLCYQLPGMMMDGICLVISPLIALMEDQVQSLEKKNIKALALSSKLNQHDTVIAFDNLLYGNYKFLYLSPEKLQSTFIQEKISQLKLSLIAIDEAPCISQWGHDFRPSYMNLSILHELHPEAPMIALTGSATPKVKLDILQHLELNDVQIFEKSFARPNLSIQLVHHENVTGTAKQLLMTCKDPSILYVGTRKDTIHFSKLLTDSGLQSVFYHGGLSHDQKTKALYTWKESERTVMVATNAFGMGIDKSNVRMIIHAHLPNSLENYMQEIGRAGRDGILSKVYLLYNDNLIFESENLMQKSMASPEFCKRVYTKLNDFYSIAFGETPEMNFNFDLQEFCATYKLPILKTYAAINQLHLENIIFYNQNPNKRSKIRVIEKSSKLFEIQSANKELGKVIQLILRNYGGIHDQLIAVNEFFLAQKLNKNRKEVIALLQTLDKDKVIIYKQQTSSVELKFLVPREENFVFHSIARHIKARNKTKIRKLGAMLSFLRNDTTCRQVQLLTYFGEAYTEACGLCDVCLKNKSKGKTDYKNLGEKILQLLQLSNPLDANEIAIQMDLDRDKVVKTLQLLIERNSIRLNLQQKFELVI
jgi:ATP-dependent DNA helicase RecQ